MDEAKKREQRRRELDQALGYDWRSRPFPEAPARAQPGPEVTVMAAVPLATTLDELRNDGVLQRYGEHYETTRRWRAARHRASVAREPASERTDLSNPIVQALIAFYGKRRAIETLSAHIAVLFALETRPPA